MIRLSGLVNLHALAEEKDKTLGSETPNDPATIASKLNKLKEMNLTPDQEKKVNELLAQMQEMSSPVPDATITEAEEMEDEEDKAPVSAMEEDHEVSMAQNLINDIIKNATELKGRLGNQERDIPAWIQDHISQAQNFISQANVNFHESESSEDPTQADQSASPMNESAPEGWEKTIKAMKKKKEIDNPWALANWMKKKGYKPMKEGADTTADAEEVKEGRFSRNPKIKAIASKLDKAVQFHDLAKTATVVNPETGETIKAITAYHAGPTHPAYNLAKTALKRSGPPSWP